MTRRAFHTEEGHHMRPEEDEISKQMRKDRDRIAWRFSKLYLIFFAVYVAVRIVHWLFDFPSSMSGVNGYAVGIAGTIFFVFAGNFVETFILEYRLRSQLIDQKLTALESHVASINKPIEMRLAAIAAALKIENAKGTGDQEAIKDDAENAETRAELIAKYRESAERGEAWGQHNLGITYYNGDRGARDYAQAAFWFRKAAVQSLSARLGDEFSPYLLAESIYANAESLPSDYEEALQWYCKVSEQNSIWSEHAEYTLGNIYETGKGVPKDYIEAVRWWQKAADRGYEMAHYQLGDLFAKGAEGVPQDYGEAYFRLYIATGGKGLGSMQKTAIGERDEVATHLTPEALSQVQERAEQWITAHPAKP